MHTWLNEWGHYDFHCSLTICYQVVAEQLYCIQSMITFDTEITFFIIEHQYFPLLCNINYCNYTLAPIL